MAERKQRLLFAADATAAVVLRSVSEMLVRVLDCQATIEAETEDVPAAAAVAQKRATGRLIYTLTVTQR